jgi:hypothetical protein
MVVLLFDQSLSAGMLVESLEFSRLRLPAKNAALSDLLTRSEFFNSFMRATKLTVPGRE